MFLINIRPEKYIKKTDAAKVVRGILYCFATSFMLEQGERCCDEFEEDISRMVYGM